MTPLFSAAHETVRRSYREFFDRAVAPRAAECDRASALPDALIAELAAQGCFSVGLPREHGGTPGDMVALGLLHEQAGRASTSVRSVITAHHMVAHTIARWGTAEQRQQWLRGLISRGGVAAFCLTESDAGSDASALSTSAASEGDNYVISGEKRWITAALIAQLFLVVARSGGQPVVLIVPRTAPGLTIEPEPPLLGARASMAGRVRFDRCLVPARNLIGTPGVGLSHVAATAVDIGRYGVAWGCVGLIDACLGASLEHARRRVQFGKPLIEHQLVRRMITDMTTDARAACQLALVAGRLRDAGDPSAPVDTVIAKYFAAAAACRAAAHAVQIHGAAGCIDEAPVARYYRDAKIMEIIEGSTEINQIAIAGWSEADA